MSCGLDLLLSIGKKFTQRSRSTGIRSSHFNHRTLRCESLEERRLLSVTPGDFNTDGFVDAADYSVWRDGLGTTYTAADYGIWASNYGTTAAIATDIELQGNSISVNGSGATADGSVLTITSAGTYCISGTLNDGQIIVDALDEDDVTIILDGVDITSSDSAAIYVANADETVITLADGTLNYLTDGASYSTEDPDGPNAALFSKDDLTINGNGSLTVNANFNNGISSNDDIKISSGNITVTAVNHGIRGKDSVEIEGGSITVNAGGDGIQSDNDEDTAKGYVTITDGTINITSIEDGIQAETNILIGGGNIMVVSGGGSSSTSGDGKGIKAVSDITINGGVIALNSTDDAVHSDGSITIAGGSLTLASADDGIHADVTILIAGGDIVITESYEGIESAEITINDGTIHLISSDDGINVADGVDGSGGGPGGPGGGGGTGHLYINGGYIVVDALGDGIDVNGSMTMTGGTVIVNGPTANFNGPLDYDGTFQMTGGFLVAVGSSQMAQAPGASSTQEAVLLTYSTTQSAGAMIHIENEEGDDLLTFVPTKAYQSVMICSPNLETGETYTVYSGGSSTGTVEDGLYIGGVYTPGTELGTFTQA